jgi:hypothetical protein
VGSDELLGVFAVRLDRSYEASVSVGELEVIALEFDPTSGNGHFVGILRDVTLVEDDRGPGDRCTTSVGPIAFDVPFSEPCTL